MGVKTKLLSLVWLLTRRKSPSGRCFHLAVLWTKTKQARRFCDSTQREQRRAPKGLVVAKAMVAQQSIASVVRQQQVQIWGARGRGRGNQGLRQDRHHPRHHPPVRQQEMIVPRALEMMLQMDALMQAQLPSGQSVHALEGVMKSSKEQDQDLLLVQSSKITAVSALSRRSVVALVAFQVQGHLHLRAQHQPQAQPLPGLEKLSAAVAVQALSVQVVLSAAVVWANAARVAQSVMVVKIVEFTHTANETTML